MSGPVLAVPAGCASSPPSRIRRIEQHHDLEQVRALLGHSRMDTMQIYASIRPAQLKHAMAFYDEQALAFHSNELPTRS